MPPGNVAIVSVRRGRGEVFAVQSERGETDAASLMHQPTDGPKIGPPPRPAAAPTADANSPPSVPCRVMLPRSCHHQDRLPRAMPHTQPRSDADRGDRMATPAAVDDRQGPCPRAVARTRLQPSVYGDSDRAKPWSKAATPTSTVTCHHGFNDLQKRLDPPESGGFRYLWAILGLNQ
jgi:hypothetical protein